MAQPRDPTPRPWPRPRVLLRQNERPWMATTSVAPATPVPPSASTAARDAATASPRTPRYGTSPRTWHPLPASFIRVAELSGYRIRTARGMRVIQGHATGRPGLVVVRDGVPGLVHVHPAHPLRDAVPGHLRARAERVVTDLADGLAAAAAAESCGTFLRALATADRHLMDLRVALDAHEARASRSAGTGARRSSRRVGYVQIFHGGAPGLGRHH